MNGHLHHATFNQYVHGPAGTVIFLAVIAALIVIAVALRVAARSTRRSR